MKHFPGYRYVVKEGGVYAALLSKEYAPDPDSQGI